MGSILNNNSGNVGILPLLGILFVGLKLTNVISWSWFWVTSPFWGSFMIIMVVMIFAVIAAVLKD